MLTITIVFRAPETCGNFEHTSLLLERTLTSLANQSNENFRVVVVCNELPILKGTYDVEFKQVDFPIPKSRHEVFMDRGIKRLIALQTCLKEPSGKHFMMLDADDLVSCNLVSKVLHHLKKHPNGLCFEAGYLLDFDARRLHKKFGFNHYCGSSLVLNLDNLFPFLNCEKDIFLQLSSYQDFLENCDMYVTKELLGGLRDQKAFFKKKGLSLKELYEPLVVWVINNGENVSKTKIGYGSVSIDKNFIAEYSAFELDICHKSLLERFTAEFRYLKSILGCMARKVIR